MVYLTPNTNNYRKNKKSFRKIVLLIYVIFLIYKINFSLTKYQLNYDIIMSVIQVIYYNLEYK